MKTAPYKLSLLVLSAATLFMVSCDKEKDPATPNSNSTGTPSYTISTTYNYTNVNYTGQTQRLSMMDAIGTYMKTGNTSGTVLDAQTMKNMYANSGNPFSDSTLNTSGKQLKNKTYAVDQAMFEAYFDSLALASQSSTPGSNGVAGVVVSNTDPSKKYLFNERGFEFTQLIEKGLMGAVFYYQSVSYYLENIASADNNTVVLGQGTNMEHNWDEAFGYFGVATDFPTITATAKYWGKYCHSRNGLLACNKIMMDAFLKGRAAITNKDNTTRDAQKTIIKENWEKVCAATAISYINSAKTNFADDALRNHALSECVGFIKSLKYNISRKITDAQITEVLNFIGSNLYTISSTNLDNAKNTLSTIYGLDSVKNSL